METDAVEEGRFAAACYPEQTLAVGGEAVDIARPKSVLLGIESVALS